jgi:hypothetical protein
VTPSPGAPDARLALGAAAEDALTRIVPALEAGAPTPQTRALAGALRGLGTALDRREGADAAPLAASLAALERALLPLETSAAGSPGELAELAAVRLVLERAAALP